MCVCMYVNVDILDVFGGFVHMCARGWVSLFEVWIDPTIKATNDVHMGTC